MKKHIRILGIDDSSFSFSQDRVKIVGVVMRLPAYIEGVLVSEVTVDGSDATEVLIEMVNSSRYKKQLKLIFIDGIALGGFNIVDIEKLARETGVGVCTVTRKPPNKEDMKKALMGHFDDWEERMAVIESAGVHEVKLDGGTAHIAAAGISPGEAEDILKASVIRGVLPEAVRMAHLIGTAIVKGESRGRA